MQYSTGQQTGCEGVCADLLAERTAAALTLRHTCPSEKTNKQTNILQSTGVGSRAWYKQFKLSLWVLWCSLMGKGKQWNRPALLSQDQGVCQMLLRKASQKSKQSPFICLRLPSELCLLPVGGQAISHWAVKYSCVLSQAHSWVSKL